MKSTANPGSASMAPDQRPGCFVAMPISTPPALVNSYQGDDRHFEHVLEHLLEPAIELAGMQPISPLTQGANIVHAEIVDKIVRSDLVLCDMSALNPNVFFEMGLRTALNKPLCFLVDDLTKPSVPFDMGIVNYHVYQSSLVPWTLEREIEELARHIRASMAHANGGNALWSHFGLQAQFSAERARPWTPSSGDDIKYLTMEVAALRRQLNDTTRTAPAERTSPIVAVHKPAGINGEIEAIWMDLPPDLARLTIADLTALSARFEARRRRAATRTEESSLEQALERVMAELARRGSG
jgi:hypothetical protein